jgi:CBS domain-containing protein
MESVSEWMHRDCVTVSPEDNIQHAANLMKSLAVTPLPVCKTRQLVGIITQRDITVRVSSAAETPENTRVGEVMSTDAYFCHEDQSVREVMGEIVGAGKQRIPVVTRTTRELVGLLVLDRPAPRPLNPIDGPVRGMEHLTASARPGESINAATDVRDR